MYRYHSLIGFKLNILMFIICLTGALAVVSHEIDWLLIDSMRVEAQADEVQWQAMYDSASAELPTSIVTALSAPGYSNFASINNAVHPQYGMRRVLSNPYTGEMLEERHWYSSAQRILRDVHRYLLYPVIGIYVVGIFGFILLASTISSLFIYKKWWRGFFTLRMHKGKRIFWGDFHKFIGVWSLWFLLVISATGSWYLVEAVIRDAGVNIRVASPKISDEYLNSIGPTPATISVSDAVAIAKKELPEINIKVIRLPVKAGDLYFIAGETGSWWVRDRANHILINPFNGSVLHKQLAEDQAILNYWVDMADPIHFGDLGGFGGLTVKIIWFLFGLGLPIMSATGTWLWLRRVSKKMRRHKVDAVDVPRKYRLWVFKPLSIAVVVIGLSIGITGITYYTFKSGPPSQMLVFGERQIGPWVGELQANGADKGITDKYILDIKCDGCMANFHKASIARGLRQQSEILGFHEFKRRSDPFYSVLSAQIPSDSKESIVTVKIEDRKGNLYFAEYY